MYFITTHTAQNFFLKLQSKNGLQKKPKKTEDVLDLFKYQIKTKTICDKEAYLLHELLKDIKYTSENHDLETPIIEHASSLKRFLVQEYSTTLHSSHPENIFLFILSISTHAHLLQHFMAVIYEILTLLKHLGEC